MAFTAANTPSDISSQSTHIADTPYQQVLKQYLSISHGENQLTFLQSIDSTQWPVLQQAQLLHLVAIAQEKLTDLDLAQQTYTQAIERLETIEVSSLLVKSYIERSFMIYLQTNDKSLYCPDRETAVMLARQVKDPESLAEALTQSAYCLDQSENFNLGLARLREALDIAQKHELPIRRQAMIFNATAALYRDQGLTENAYEYFQRAYNLWRQVDDVQDSFNMLHNLVGESIKLRNWQDNQQHLQLMLQMAQDFTQYPDFEFFYYLNAGRSAYHQNNFPMAERLLAQALALQTTTKEQHFIDNAYGLLSLSYFMQNKTDLAVEKANQFIESATFTSHNDDIREANLAISEYAGGFVPQSLKRLLMVIESEQARYAKVVKNNVVYVSLDHNLTVAEYEKIVLQKELSIKELELSTEKKSQNINQLTMIVTVLVIASLLMAVGFLFYSRKQFIKLARTDFLANVANRGYAVEQGEKLFREAKKHHKAFAVVIFDIDNFKQLNDQYGHDIGDKAIKALAARAKRMLKQRDILGRFGGEEFLMILPNASGEQAVQVAERVRKAIEQQVFSLAETQLHFTVSIGVAVMSDKYDSFEAMIKSADIALYQAKGQGKNQTQLAR
ncbi:diguanylate cyclase [Shewanella maritima]|uniref:diguanylate cyclase n=1 Tax=Shewanella maritima TaxID=2520507 RepID=UPI003735E949